MLNAWLICAQLTFVDQAVCTPFHFVSILEMVILDRQAD